MTKNLVLGKKPTFEKKPMILADFIKDWIPNIDCQPVGQRLETDFGTDKREGILGAIIDGINIGEITICKSPTNPDGYEFESIDGGHRKRYTRDYIMGSFPKRFEVRGKHFSELTKAEQDAILNYPITLVVYDELDTFTKGYIFRTLNETTDVNDQEMRNSFGDIDVANLIRETVRIVEGIYNMNHPLFETTSGGNYRLLMFDNKRLKTEELIARIVYRLTQDSYLGESSQDQLNEMYRDSNNLDMIKIKKDLSEVLEFLRIMATVHLKIYNRGLSQQDFKMLSFVWMYLKDTYKKWRIEDMEDFLKGYKKGFSAVSDKDGKYGKILNNVDFDKRGRTIAEAFISYLGAPNHIKKVKQAMYWLLGEFNIEDYIIVLDSKRGYTHDEKVRKLIEQDYKCYITRKKVVLGDCEASHIISYVNGGKSTYDNFVMCLKDHNRAMGTMNLEDYKKTLQKVTQLN